ncbi:MAG: 7-cyano-7-deazaguanine synthase [Hyphomicrobium sp.]|nr:MAG: 7-cyano-7-deazaguanine synthase [Hyphomicrobium sp.]
MKVLLFSGGIESTCLAFILKPDVCLTVDYGQLQAEGEIRASACITNYLGLQHAVIQVDAGPIGSGQMAGKPTIQSSSIPEFWPFRNQFLVTLAAMKYAPMDLTKVILGSSKSDASHVDGTPQFYDAFANVMRMQEGGVEVSAPAIELDSFEFVVSTKINPDVLDMTFSCFVAEYPCGRCRGCKKNEEIRSRYHALYPTCTFKT